MAPQPWSAADLDHIAAAQELRIATPDADGNWRRPVPVWVVVADGSVYIRTWYRRTSGWYGRAIRTGLARVEVPGLSSDVAVADVADAGADLRASVDEAFRAKYCAPGDATVSGMVTDEAAMTTLHLTPVD